MAVKIRLMRVGKKKQPTYRVVVADARSPRDGRIIETLGQYRPREEPSLIDIDDSKALEWLRKGAQPSEQVQKLLTVTGVWATFEAEKGHAPVTQLSRRAYVTGRGPATTKTSKKQQAEASPGSAAAPVAAAAEPEAKADEPAPAADEAPAAEAEQPATEAAEETPAVGGDESTEEASE